MKKLLITCFLVFLSLDCIAQIDSVWIEGRVIDAISGEPKFICEVQFIQTDTIKAIAFCDENGYYSIGWMPVGVYTLSVLLDGKMLHYAELSLVENALVNIALLSNDTVRFNALRPVEVTETRHKLGNRLITSPDDPRLWNFNNNPILKIIDPASSGCGNSRGASYFSDPRNLASWRPEWLDAPWSKKVKGARFNEPQNVD